VVEEWERFRAWELGSLSLKPAIVGLDGVHATYWKYSSKGSELDNDHRGQSEFGAHFIEVS
jgi:hypothetical protein